MPANINRVTIAGNLTRDPAIRQVGQNLVCDFGIAINRKYRDKSGEMREDVTFVDIEVWGKIAENCDKYLNKGSNCLIEGSLKLDQWQAPDGSKKSRMKVRAEAVHFLGGNNSGQRREETGYRGEYTSGPPPEVYDEDEPPF